MSSIKRNNGLKCPGFLFFCFILCSSSDHYRKHGSNICPAAAVFLVLGLLGTLLLSNFPLPWYRPDPILLFSFGILAFYSLFGQTLFVPGQGGTTITNIKQSAEKNKSSSSDSGQIKLGYSQLQTIQSELQSINVYLEPSFCPVSKARPVCRLVTNLRSGALFIFPIKFHSILIESFKILLHFIVSQDHNLEKKISQIRWLGFQRFSLE